jgi:Fe-S cluster assembly protein SufD
LVQHATPESHQDYKGIFSDRSTRFQREDFAEKRHKKPPKSNNILLSDKATINAKTTIRDFADDKMFTMVVPSDN